MPARTAAPNRPPAEAALPGGQIDSEPLPLASGSWYWASDPEPAIQIEHARLEWHETAYQTERGRGWYVVVRDREGTPVMRSGPWTGTPEALSEAMIEMFPAERGATRESLAELDDLSASVVTDGLTTRLIEAARGVAAACPDAPAHASTDEPRPQLDISGTIDELQEAANTRLSWLQR